MIIFARYVGSGSNLKNVASGSMSNLHTASTVEKPPARPDTEFFAVPKVCPIHVYSEIYVTIYLICVFMGSVFFFS